MIFHCRWEAQEAKSFVERFKHEAWRAFLSRHDQGKGGGFSTNHFSLNGNMRLIRENSLVHRLIQVGHSSRIRDKLVPPILAISSITELSGMAILTILSKSKDVAFGSRITNIGGTSREFTSFSFPFSGYLESARWHLNCRL